MQITQLICCKITDKFQHIRTTQNSYGKILEYQQVEIMDAMRRSAKGGAPGVPDDQTIAQVLDYVAKKTLRASKFKGIVYSLVGQIREH